jgi:hypothetical protein
MQPDKIGAVTIVPDRWTVPKKKILEFRAPRL